MRSIVTTPDTRKSTITIRYLLGFHTVPYSDGFTVPLYATCTTPYRTAKGWCPRTVRLTVQDSLSMSVLSTAETGIYGMTLRHSVIPSSFLLFRRSCNDSVTQYLIYHHWQFGLYTQD